MADDTTETTSTTALDPDQLDSPVERAPPSPFQKAGELVVRAARAASNAATIGTLALAHAMMEAIPGPPIVPLQDPVRMQQYITLPEIGEHIRGIVSHSEANSLANSIDGNNTENGERFEAISTKEPSRNEHKRRRTVLREQLQAHEIIDLLDDAFAPSIVLGGYGPTVGYMRTWRTTRDLLIDGSAQLR